MFEPGHNQEDKMLSSVPKANNKFEMANNSHQQNMHFPPEIFPSIDNDQKGGTLALFPLISPSISSEFSPLFFQFVSRWRKISLFHLHSPRRSGSRDHFTNTTTTNSRSWFCPSKCISWSKEISRLFFFGLATFISPPSWQSCGRGRADFYFSSQDFMKFCCIAVCFQRGRVV